MCDGINLAMNLLTNLPIKLNLNRAQLSALLLIPCAIAAMTLSDIASLFDQNPLFCLQQALFLSI